MFIRIQYSCEFEIISGNKLQLFAGNMFSEFFHDLCHTNSRHYRIARKMSFIDRVWGIEFYFHKVFVGGEDIFYGIEILEHLFPYQNIILKLSNMHSCSFVDQIQDPSS